ncbi:adenylate/guanylate cyclase domain-containing protein [Mucilaginibacter terrae]|uniref:adenylate/guanylate cyclase domain-containing protein n=1 Tax=Mucilaginibacter terrae TaxID=1955052 RepID=UPI0036281F1E
MKLNIPCLNKRHNQLIPAKEIFDFNTTMPHAISCTRLPDDTVVCSSQVDEPGMQIDHTNTNVTDFVQKCTVLGDEKELALLFLDIRNFTSFMEQRAPYDVIYVIRKLFVLFNDSIREVGGRIIETMGDSIYAVFGLESDLQKAVQSSMDASLAIFHDLEVFNTTYAQSYFNLNFEIGIGLHQGKVLVGEYDMDYNNHLTVMGLPVNIAARLQAETKELNNDLLISEDAYRFLENMNVSTPSKKVRLRGITEPVQVRLMGNAYQRKPGNDDMMDYYLSMAG